MYGAPPDALESAPPAMGPVPPDARGATVRDHLMAAAQMLLADRILDQDEMQAVGEFLQVLQQVKSAQTALGNQGGMGGAAQARIRSSGGFSPPQPGMTVDSSVTGVPKYGGY